MSQSPDDRRMFPPRNSSTTADCQHRHYTQTDTYDSTFYPVWDGKQEYQSLG